MILKTVQKNTHSKLILLILEFLNLQYGLFRKSPPRYFVAVNIVLSSTIELIKQTWFLLAIKGSQTEGFSGN